MSKIKPIIYTNQNQKLFGILHQADNLEEKAPVVIFNHGFIGNKSGPHRMFVKLAERLAKKGLSSFRFDFRGSGDSEGKFKRKTLSGEIFDTMKVIELLQKREDVDEDNIFLLGFGLGGAVAACAATRSGEVSNLVLWSPIAELDKLFFDNLLKGIEQESLDKRNYVSYQGFRIGKDFLDELKLIKPIHEIRAYQGQMFIVHGRKDEIVPVSHAFSYYQNLRNENKELLIIEEADHRYLDYDLEQELISATLDWIVTQVETKKDVDRKKK